MRTVAVSFLSRKPMRPSVPGILLIVIGVLFLLRNLGFDLHLGELFATWWPLALVALGVGMMFKNRRA
ncbi:LiaI-LiaF-like domain-containing protein [Frateuria sp. GZRR35]|uniref:LiaI-LiaF-like domain-containing protein n=1 Tax=unclassified Frateuria TaxID=2648894 RepID=UPI003EDBCA06